MINRLLSAIFGSKNDRELRRYRKTIQTINALEEEMSSLTDSELADLRIRFKERLHAGENLDDVLPEAFAAVREAGKRALDMRIFDVQLIGGMVLHEGRIAEMRTGEGKTLVATLALYLNALTGEGVHLVTVNDYLAKWGAEWMGPLYRTLGMFAQKLNWPSFPDRALSRGSTCIARGSTRKNPRAL